MSSNEEIITNKIANVACKTIAKIGVPPFPFRLSQENKEKSFPILSVTRGPAITIALIVDNKAKLNTAEKNFPHALPKT